MPTWFEREEDQLVDAVNSGEISERDFRADMRSLQDDLRSEAEEAAAEAAERAYNDVMGGW